MKVLRFAAALALALGAMACLSAGLPGPGSADGSAARTLGSFSVSPGGDSGAAWSVSDGVAEACIAGDHQLFFGADFLDRRQGAVLRLVVDPLGGAAVRIFDRSDPERRTRVVHPQDCRTFRYRLEPTGWRINDFRDYEVELKVDCATPEGAQVKAAVAARHCS